MKNKNVVFYPIVFLSILLISFSSLNNSYLSKNDLLETMTPTNIFITSPSISVDILLLNSRLESLENSQKIESNAFSAAIARSESNMNFLLAIIAISTILLAIIGLSVVKTWIAQSVNQYISKTTSNQMNLLIEKEIQKLRSDWDSKFSELYEEYKRIVKR
jgi:hypothetical protein